MRRRPCRPIRTASVVQPATRARPDHPAGVPDPDGRRHYYSAWGTNNRTTVTLVDGRLSSGTRARRGGTGSRVLPQPARRPGVAASCRVPDSVTLRNPLVLSFEMRLGDDHVDTSALPAQFAASALLDAGVDEARTGAGDDFVNGAFQRDLIITGAGDDWVRRRGPRRSSARPARIDLVGGEAGDLLRGGDGNDLVEGGPGDDEMYGDAGADRLSATTATTPRRTTRPTPSGSAASARPADPSGHDPQVLRREAGEQAARSRSPRS